MLKRFYWIVGSILLGVNSVYAIDMIPSNAQYYYHLGGGSDIGMLSPTDQQNITVGGDVNTNLGYTCTGFNPAVSMANSINNIENSTEALPGEIINSATAAIGSFPMYLLEKASPEIYNLIQNAMTHASDSFHLSMKSCQAALTDIKNNKSPYQDWFGISDSQGWLNYSKQAQQGQDVDINNAQKELAKNPSEYGLPWIHKGQNSGGSSGNQKPIRVIYDVVVAGFNVMIDQHRDLDSQELAPSNSELARYWKTPDDAGKWAQLVLGDIKISSEKDQDDTHPGVGLVTVLRSCPNQANNNFTCVKDLRNAIQKLVSSNQPITAELLQKISSNELMITPQIIEYMRNQTPEIQVIMISKLAEDVALQNLIDEALLLRRILIAGTQTKPVHNVKPALTMVQNTIKQLDQDIKNLKFEHDIRQSFTSNTLKTFIAQDQLDQIRASSHQEQTQAPNMQGGAVYNKTEN